MVRIIIILLLVVLQAVMGVPEYFYGESGVALAPATDFFYGSYWLRALTYSFFHASWWHLAVNALASWSIYSPKRKTSCIQIVSSFIIAVLVYPLALRPVLGFSNVLYAILGLRTPPLSSPWWKRGEVIVFLIVTVALLAIPRFSAVTHIASFLLGMGGAAVGRGWQKLTQDARRYY